ncbi:MAG TPA: CBS domain-containing protein [Pedococcus sp.]|jgi:CBS domain-containing protein|nr:CBS domain-containing protein [Pedococcus sp.]
MLVREVMTSPATSLRAGSRLETAVQVLAAQHITAVPIVDAYGHVVGIVSDADVLREGLPEDPRTHLRPTQEPTTPWHRLVDDIMTVDPVTVGSHTDVARAAELMADMGWKSLPVVRDGQLVGVISRSDVIRVLATPDRQVQERIAYEFSQIGREDWRVEVDDGEVTLRDVAPGREARLARAIVETLPGVRRVRVEGQEPIEPSGNT